MDDDVYLPKTAVEQLYRYLIDYDADIISPDVFPNAERSFLGKCMMMLSGRMLARKDDGNGDIKLCEIQVILITTTLKQSHIGLRQMLVHVFL